MPELAAIPGVAELWELTQGEPAVSVAMIDGPVDLTHPCFRGADVEVVAPTWLPAQIVELRPGAPRRRLEHGTWVASVLFGQHGSEVSGLAPGCHGLLLPCLRGDISEPDPANMARAIEIAVQGGASVVLIESCIPTLSGDVDDLLKRTLRNAAQDGVLVIAGSGNQGAKETCFPAASPDVLAVGAYDDDGRVYAYSNWGAEYEGHGLVAPGGNITGALPGGGTTTHHGTSCSGPIVAGVAALLLSLQLQRGAAADPLSVRRALLETAAPCSARSTDGEPRRCIAGRLDVAAATQLVLAQLRARRASSARSGVRSSSADAGADTSAGLASSLLVYALGALGYDFTSQTRREAFERFMTSEGSGPADAFDERRVLDHLVGHPADAAALTWTLSLEGSPVYALSAVGPYAAEIHVALIRLLAGQAALDERARLQRVCLAGRLTDRRVELLSEQVVAVVEIDGPRGLHGLNVAALADAAITHLPALSGVARQALRAALSDFLTRVHVEMANVGVTPAQRALNFAATNAYQAADSFAAALARGMVFDCVDTQRSAVCRLDSDCWDVRLRFFDPENGRRSRRLYRFTIDVSDVLPVTLGEVRSWSESAAARVAA